MTSCQMEEIPHSISLNQKQKMMLNIKKKITCICNYAVYGEAFQGKMNSN